MENTNELVDKINKKFTSLSKGHKLIAEYILANYDKAAFLTAARLGQAVGVSESTVVRFAMSLGYKGYPEFQAALEKLIKDKLNDVQKMEAMYCNVSRSEILINVLKADIEKIDFTLNNIDSKSFELAVDIILNAKSVYIIGLRSCAPLASLLGFYLNMIVSNVNIIHTNCSSDIFEQLMRISKDDVIIGISFPRYSMKTLKAMEFANDRNAKVITLTDDIHSPINLYSSCNLVAKSDIIPIGASLVAPLSIINALVAALSMKKQNEVIKTLETLEEIYDEYQVYSSDELNPISCSMDSGFKINIVENQK